MAVDHSTDNPTASKSPQAVMHAACLCNMFAMTTSWSVVCSNHSAQVLPSHNTGFLLPLNITSLLIKKTFFASAKTFTTDSYAAKFYNPHKELYPVEMHQQVHIMWILHIMQIFPSTNRHKWASVPCSGRLRILLAVHRALINISGRYGVKQVKLMT